MDGSSGKLLDGELELGKGIFDKALPEIYVSERISDPRVFGELVFGYLREPESLVEIARFSALNENPGEVVRRQGVLGSRSRM